MKQKPNNFFLPDLVTASRGVTSHIYVSSDALLLTYIFFCEMFPSAASANPSSVNIHPAEGGTTTPLGVSIVQCSIFY